MSEGEIPLQVGAVHSECMVVEGRHTVPQFAPGWAGFSGMPPVFATVMMIGFMEHACVQAVQPRLGRRRYTVGTAVDIRHVAATAIGMMVEVKAELIAIDGRTLRFRVMCTDGGGMIGEGYHDRVIVDAERFLQRLDDRMSERDNSES